MKQLTKTQSAIYALGGILLLLGAVLPVVPPAEGIAPPVLAAGALMFSSMQMLARYDGKDPTVRRLRRQQVLGAIFLLLSAGLLCVHAAGAAWLRGNEWKMFLAIGAVFEVYTAFRIPAALKKAGEA